VWFPPPPTVCATAGKLGAHKILLFEQNNAKVRETSNITACSYWTTGLCLRTTARNAAILSYIVTKTFRRNLCVTKAAVWRGPSAVHNFIPKGNTSFLAFANSFMKLTIGNFVKRFGDPCKFQFQLENPNNGQFTWIPTCVRISISNVTSAWLNIIQWHKFSNKICRENWNTHLISNTLFPHI
jgi:hypothetical protein